MKKLLCIGHLNIEDIFYAQREPAWRTAGGAALYAATAANLWNVAVSLVSRVGEDYPGEYLGALQEGGVDIRYVRHVSGATMAGRTTYEADGSRTYQMYADAARRLELTPQVGDWNALTAEDWDAAHIATMPPWVQSDWLDALRSRVPFLSLDTDISFIQKEPDAFRALLSRVDAFFPNQDEAHAFAPGGSLEQAAARLLELGPRLVVIKRGAQGASVYTRGAAPLHVPAIAVQAVDVTGAGDSFAGGFAAGYLLGGGEYPAACMGIVSATLAIADYGGLHTLNRRFSASHLLQSFTSHP